MAFEFCRAHHSHLLPQRTWPTCAHARLVRLCRWRNICVLVVWYQGTVLRIGSLLGTPDLFQLPPPLAHKVNPILAFGKNDIVAIMRWDDMTNMPIITAFLIVFISGPFCISFMYLSLRWLIGEFVRPAFPKESKG